MTVFDAHAHAGGEQELSIRRALGIRTMLSCGHPEEAKTVHALCCASPVFQMTAGIHPWYADRVRMEDMLPYMQSAVLVGEIGLDALWCDTPLPAQRRAFCAQLDWAAANGKGIVLHTKGCESEIAQRIQSFPHPVVVHWYSGEESALERFLAMNCFFTIGPDVGINPCVQAVAARVPNDRILFETDGMEAVCWALGDMKTDALPQTLEGSLRTAAQLRNQSPKMLLEYANGNFLRLL